MLLYFSEFCLFFGITSRIIYVIKMLMKRFLDAQCIYTVGILTEIGRAYMTIDNDLYLWNFDEKLFFIIVFLILFFPSNFKIFIIYFS